MEQEENKVGDLFEGFIQNHQLTKLKMKENALKIVDALEREDFEMVANLSAEMVMNCGSILPVQEVMSLVKMKKAGLLDQ